MISGISEIKFPPVTAIFQPFGTCHPAPIRRFRSTIRSPVWIFFFVFTFDVNCAEPTFPLRFLSDKYVLFRGCNGGKIPLTAKMGPLSSLVFCDKPINFRCRDVLIVMHHTVIFTLET